ncbi:probable RNA-binding protein 18 [Haliotis rubra]|uniref:probable RNA-binding protein 18 n=1 Tax=Haliotis rubra TaxID=36100 RepID=UPI001EE583B9|nr:probable RNA-binding protein 18 [Haliotis rubra]XP_046560849.1 probable RNA-binding protein 18 [Haliotis rubra]XP_046560850.1 probable RNA-binding protein 18 [Haliotis rubra]
MGESPLDVPDDPGQGADDCRLWIGNLDSRLTEFTLLKVVQRYGDLQKFDFLYNKAGPEIGKPRGYCFVSYHNRQNAEKALKALNGKLALSKKLIVRWAHQEKQKTDINAKLPEKNVPPDSVDVKIHAIEAKLEEMSKTQKDFTISNKVEAAPGSSKLSIANPENIRNQPVLKPKPYYRKHRR